MFDRDKIKPRNPSDNQEKRISAKELEEIIQKVKQKDSSNDS